MIPLPFPDHRVIIVGAGQSGLAVASALCVAGLVPQKDFTVIDANAGAQRSWGSRWHSMELLSPARDSVITDRPLAGDPMRHPRADELAAYLDAIEASLGVTTMWGISATSVQHEDTSLVLGTTDGQFRAENVVCATGAAHVPWVPRWASVLAVPGAALHSADYSFPLQIPAGEVLIIGDGHSGMQLAQELLHSHTVTLSTRPRRRRRNARSISESGWRRPWLSGRARSMTATSHADLRRQGVTIVPAAVAADRDEIVFESGDRTAVQSVIFATGYRPGDGWLPRSVREASPILRLRGTTTLPGLFVAGMPGYSRPGADTLAGVRRDASAIASRILNHQ